MLDRQTHVCQQRFMPVENRAVGTNTSLSKGLPFAVLLIHGSTKAPRISIIHVQNDTMTAIFLHQCHPEHVEHNIYIFAGIYISVA